MSVLVAIGHSHIGSIRTASEVSPAPFSEVRILPLRRPQFAPNLVFRGDRGELSGVVADEISRAVDGADLVALLLNGNEHSQLGIVESAEPFDFVVPGRTDLPLDDRRRLIPANLMWWRVRIEVRVWETFLRAVVESDCLRGLPAVVVCPPPPSDANHVKMHPGPFGNRLATDGATPDHVRLKIWLTQRSVVETFTASLGVAFLPPPSQMIGPDGMLAPEARREDPTHTNRVYGAAVLQQLGTLAGIPLATTPIAV